MKKIMKDTKGCDQLSPNDNSFGVIWLSGVKTVEEAGADRVYYCGPVKTIHKVFLLATLEKSMKYFLGGSYLIMKITPRYPGVCV